MTGLFLVWVNTQPPNYGRDYLKQDMKAAGQSFTGLLSASYSTLFLAFLVLPPFENGNLMASHPKGNPLGKNPTGSKNSLGT